jgi:aminopeptidase-like protein
VSVELPSARTPAGSGERLQALVQELFPICRSVTGDGVRETLAAVAERIPLDVHEVPTGAPVLDWTVPNEWNVRDAYIAKDGRRIIDFQDSNLHLVNYSEPFRGKLSLEELRPRLHSLPEHPSWIPYRTSYYSRTWGFCLADEELRRLEEAEYEVVVDTTLAPGSLTYGECYLPGEREDEVLLTTHVCHPSLANDNLSGIAVLTELAALLREARRTFSYRLLFIPGTIGSITWLARNKDQVDRIVAGLTLACVGDGAPLTYKRSQRGNAMIDRAAAYALPRVDEHARFADFIPWGWDERQFNSPGFDLPVGSLCRSREGDFAEYHSSADGLDFVRPEALEHALSSVVELLRVVDDDRHYMNLAPEGEPQLGKRGLYPTVGGSAAEQEQIAMLWVLNQSDGCHSLLDIAERSELPFELLSKVALKLRDAELLAERVEDSS